jgi:hypothetical protein
MMAGAKWKCVAALALLVMAGAAESNDYGMTMPADARYVHIQRVIDYSMDRALRSNQEADLQAFASMGWLQGVYATLILNGAGGGNMGICPADGLTGGTMARIYVTYMDGHPKTHQMPDLAVAVLSAMEAYPCPKHTS